MNVRILPSAADSEARCQFLMSYLVDECVAIDAGCLGLLTPAAQQQVQHIFLSHSHIDHVATLPIFLDNVFRPGADCPQVYGSSATLAALRSDVFNDRIWPDFEALSTPEGNFVRFVEISAETSIEVAGLRVTPLELDHVVPTLGFQVSSSETSIAILSDTLEPAATRALATMSDRLEAVFLECSFPNSHQRLADESKHLTPATFATAARQLPGPVRVIAIHVKPDFYETTVAEIGALGLPAVSVGLPGSLYEF